MSLISRLTGSLFAIAFTSNIAAADVQVISADLAHEAAAKGEIILVDIRTPDEWSQTGMPEHAIGIDVHNKDFMDQLQTVMTKNPHTPVAMICASGSRSTMATKALNRSGVKGLINVAEGMMGSRAGPGWLKQGLPVKRP